ncbi:MAG: Rpp14/Pop5 family protein [Nanoarchaeota archaeon]
MLGLKPTMRANRRYLLIQGTKTDIETAILEYIGMLGWAKAAPVFASSHDGKIILAVNREAIADVRAALALAREKINVSRVSGTLSGVGK